MAKTNGELIEPSSKMKQLEYGSLNRVKSSPLIFYGIRIRLSACLVLFTSLTALLLFIYR